MQLLEELWHAGTTAASAEAGELPAPARLYLQHALAPATPLACAVRLRMHGEIKLKRWLPFKAEQVVHVSRGFVWRASVRMNGLPVRGFDRLVDGQGEMRWKLLGIFPVMIASGADITRSAAGRFVFEALWLPSIFCGGGVTWTARTPLSPAARLTVSGETVEVTMEIDGTGRLLSVKAPRWGNPEGGAFHYADFGGVAEEERTFQGYTVPTRVRVGWHFGTDRFPSEGEFFRAAIDEAVYR